LNPCAAQTLLKKNCSVSAPLEARIPQKHPLRQLRKVVDLLLATLNDDFDALYARRGRDSIPPERLLRASLLQVLFSIRSERQLVEHIDFNLLYRWFVGLTMDDEVWDHSTFSANRDRLLNEQISRLFFERVLALADWKDLISDEHFSVDGTLIQAWASHKSFVKKDGSTPPPEDGGRNPTVNFKGEKRSNETHASTTDPDARLYKKNDGDKSQLAFLRHALMDLCPMGKTATVWLSMSKSPRPPARRNGKRPKPWSSGP